jgi:hypothetical protein
MNTPQQPPAGERFAADLRAVIQQLGLLNVLTARFLPQSQRLRLVWVRGSEGLDFPATPEWVGRIRSALPIYAQGRRAGFSNLQR